jgi:hypothetical protein
MDGASWEETGLRVGGDGTGSLAPLKQLMPPVIVTPRSDGKVTSSGGLDLAAFLGDPSAIEVGGTGIEPATKRV